MARITSIQTLKHHELRSSRTGEAFSFSAVLTDYLGIDSLFVHHDVIPPGRRASETHFHTSRDEIVIVLQGRVRARYAGEEIVLQEGDVIAFPAGPENSHHIANDGSEQASILVVASNPSDDVVMSG